MHADYTLMRMHLHCRLFFVIRSEIPNANIAADAGLGPELNCVAIRTGEVCSVVNFVIQNVDLRL